MKEHTNMGFNLENHKIMIQVFNYRPAFHMDSNNHQLTIT